MIFLSLNLSGWYIFANNLYFVVTSLLFVVKSKPILLRIATFTKIPGEGGGREVDENEGDEGALLLGEELSLPSNFSLDWGLSNPIVFTSLFHEISS